MQSGGCYVELDPGDKVIRAPPVHCIRGGGPGASSSGGAGRGDRVIESCTDRQCYQLSLLQSRRKYPPSRVRPFLDHFVDQHQRRDYYSGEGRRIPSMMERKLPPALLIHTHTHTHPHLCL